MKKTILVLLVLLLTVGFSVSATSGDNVQVTLGANIPQILQIYFSDQNPANSQGTAGGNTKTYTITDWVENTFDSNYNVLGNQYSTGISVIERSNRSYVVTIGSDNTFELLNGTEAIPYTLHYGDDDFNSETTPLTINETKTTGLGTTKTIGMTLDSEYSESETMLSEGTYSDTLTFTISAE